MNKIKKVYLYGVDGSLIGDYNAEEDPLHKGHYVHPSNATPEKPPKVGKDEIAVFENGKWIVKPNLVGQTFWTSYFNSVTINRIGVTPPDGATLERPEMTLEDAKLLKLREIDEMYSKSLTDMHDSFEGNTMIEGDTWDMQTRDARDYFATGKESALLKAMAEERGDKVHDLAEKIIEKSEAHATIIGKIIGKRSRLIKEVEAVKDVKTKAAIKKAIESVEKIKW